jgi:hypothetical protein
MKMRSAHFLIEPQNQYQWFELKTTGMICHWFDLKTTKTIFFGLSSKPVVTVFPGLA